MIIKLAWRNIWRNKRRSIITIVSILIAVFLSVSMRSMQLGMYDHMIKSIVASYSGYIQIHANGYMDQQTIDNSIEVNYDLLDSIASINGVKNIIKRLQTFSLASSGDLTKGVLIQGVEIEINDLIARANVIDVTKLEKKDSVIFGSTVHLIDLEINIKKTYKIVGKDEADITKNYIYFRSPIGKALIGKNKKDIITVTTPSGEKNLEIIEVKYI